MNFCVVLSKYDKTIMMGLEDVIRFNYLYDIHFG